PGAVVIHRRGLAMHQPAARHAAAEMLADRLVPQADPEQGLAGIGAGGDEVEADPRLVGRAGPRRDQEALRAARQRLPRRDCVIAYDIDLSTQFHQVMDQVEGEAVVVVDDEDHGAAYCPNPGSAAMRAASRAAASSAAALASHSRCS